MYTMNDGTKDVAGPISIDVDRARLRTRETAQRMVLLSLRQWERAIGGILALPSAVAMTTAAGAMLVTSMCERAFELVETTAMDVGRRSSREFDAHGELRVNGQREDRRDAASA